MSAWIDVFGFCLFADLLDELQEHVEAIDMANGEFMLLFLSLCWLTA